MFFLISYQKLNQNTIFFNYQNQLNSILWVFGPYERRRFGHSWLFLYWKLILGKNQCLHSKMMKLFFKRQPLSCSDEKDTPRSNAGSLWIKNYSFCLNGTMKNLHCSSKTNSKNWKNRRLPADNFHLLTLLKVRFRKKWPSWGKTLLYSSVFNYCD